MNLGQLHDGADAISYYEAGVRELRAARDALVNAGGSRDELSGAWMEATHKLASGLCSIAELYLTDACDDERAEDNCERLAAEAVELVSAFEPQLLVRRAPLVGRRVDLREHLLLLVHLSYPHSPPPLM